MEDSKSEIELDTSTSLGRKVKSLLDENVHVVRAPELCPKPLVSVALMTYNHVNYIEQAIESVLMQETDFPFEIVISDDCSTDGTREIVEQYQRRYPEKIVLVLADRNLWKVIPGIKTTLAVVGLLGACRGNYIALLEGDDYWTSPKKLQRQVEYLESQSSYVAHCHNCYFKDETDKQTDIRLFSKLPSRNISIRDICPARTFHTASIVFRRDGLRDIDWHFFFSHVASGDKFLFTHLFLKGSIFYDERPSAFYRRNEGGFSKSPNLHLFMDADVQMYARLAKTVPAALRVEMREAANFFKVERYKFLLGKKVSPRLFYYFLSLSPIVGFSRHLSLRQYLVFAKSLIKKVRMA